MSQKKRMSIYAITEDGVPVHTDYCDPELSENLVLIVLEDGLEQHRLFLISPTHPFGNLVSIYAKQDRYPRSQLKFVYNDCVIRDTDTFYSLQLEYGACIKVMSTKEMPTQTASS